MPFAIVVGLGSGELLSVIPVPKGRELVELKPHSMVTVN